jgi:histidyl-tRNA synthetase
MVGKHELETGKIPIKDCQNKQEFKVNKEELISWICDYL